MNETQYRVKMEYPLMPYTDKEMVIVSDGPMDLKMVSKQGWVTLVFIGFASVRRMDGFLARLIPRFKQVPMFKLTKAKEVTT